MNLKDAIDRTVRCYPDETAVVTDGERSVTYADLDARATRLANALTRRVGTERCAVLSVNTMAAIESMLAGNKRGVATVQLSYRATVEELAEMADTAAATAVVFDDHNADEAL